MAQFRPEHFSGTVRTTKDDLRYGPLKWRRVNTLPPNTYGRNGDFVIVDDTTETDERQAIFRTPESVDLCQKIPFVVTAGDFTVTVVSGVYTISINGLDDFVDAINRANIPELRAEFSDPKSPDGGNNFIIRAVSATFADGTSDLPSVLGISGLQNGDVTIATGSWQCFPVGSTGINLESSGTAVPPGGFTTLNFTGPGVTSVVDSGGGTATITISGGGAGGVAYGVITGDAGPPATATAASENITFGGVGVTVVTTDGVAGTDTVSFNLDVADLPAGGGPVLTTDTIAINQGGTTLEYPLSALTGVVGGLAFGTVTGGDGGSAVAVTISDTITVNGDGINVTATNAGAGLDTLDLRLDISDLAAGGGPVLVTDTIAINQGGTTFEYPISSLAGLVGGNAYGSIAGGDGGTATATTASELITINGTGISVTATDAGAGSDTMDFVLDIADLPAGAGPLTGTDEIAVNDGGTTERHSINDVVDAALPGLTITTINSQPMLTLVDTTRGPKTLSVAEQALQFNENALGPGDDWMRIGNANDIDTGYIMDFDGTIVYATVHCENSLSGGKDFRLFINAADNGVILTIGGALNATAADETLNIDFAQGDRLRIRCDTGIGNTIGDTVLKLTVKWRG